MNQATPSLAVDLVILNRKAGVLYAIQRKFPPLGLALPGGFVEIGETCENAARREAMEETNLKLDRLHFIGVYDDPQRDPRKHVVSVAFIAVTKDTPTAGDDADKIVPISLKDIQNSVRGQMYEESGEPAPAPPVFPWCFDHAQIVKDAYLRFDYNWADYGVLPDETE